MVANNTPTLGNRTRLIAPARGHRAHVAGCWLTACVGEGVVPEARRGAAVVPEVGILAAARRFQQSTSVGGDDALLVGSVCPAGGLVVRTWPRPAT